MTGAMYASVAGLKTHMQALNVIGNNIANVNTNGYKSGRYIFQSALYTNLRNGSDGTDTVGGKNPSQIGYGVSVGSVDIDMGTSTYSPTGKATDCMIDGDGFFLLGETKELTFANGNDLKKLTLTKVGDIEFKADGYLCNRNGDIVYGFLGVGYGPDGKTPVVDNTLQPIHLPKVTADGTVIYNDTQFTAYMTQIGTEYYTEAGITVPTSMDDLAYAEMDSISIDEATGKISGIMKDTDEIVTIAFIAIGNVTNPNGVTQETGTYYKCGDGAGDMSVSILGAAAQEVYDYDYIDSDGDNYSFVDKCWTEFGDPPETNPNGRMTHIGGSTYETMRIHTGGTTSLITSGLEQTNVDLATEISNMILIQRGYQANTRVVTVTDSMLEELVNMKR